MILDSTNKNFPNSRKRLTLNGANWKHVCVHRLTFLKVIEFVSQPFFVSPRNVPKNGCEKEKREEKKDNVLLVKSFYKLFLHVVCSDDNDSLQSVGQVSQHRALTYRLHSLDFTRGLQIISTRRGVQQSLQNGTPILLK